MRTPRGALVWVRRAAGVAGFVVLAGAGAGAAGVASTHPTGTASAASAATSGEPAAASAATNSEPAAPGAATAPAGTRNPLQWPFARRSVWNTPIGSRARYLPARIGSTAFEVDVVWFVVTRAEDPAVPVYSPATSGNSRCRGTRAQPQALAHPAAARRQHLPRSFVLPGALSAAASGGGGDSSAFLQPDGRTLVSYDRPARCRPGGPLYGRWSGETSLFGDGIAGGYGGSGMSGVGGSLRTGELTGKARIRHALKLRIPGRYLFYDRATGGRRWPARLADTDAVQRYTGSVEALRTGALLALPATATPQRLGVRSAAGWKILTALRDYGGYVAGDSGRDVVDLGVEHRAVVEFAQQKGHAVEADPGLRADLPRIIRALAVVDDNRPSSIGGAGRRRAEWAPPFRAASATRPVPAGGGTDAAASRPSASAAASAIRAGRVADVESPDHAPAPAVEAVAIGALGLLLVGLWSGRRMLRPSPAGRAPR